MRHRYNMSGDYPMMANWLIENKKEYGVYEIKNVLTDETLRLDRDAYRFLRNLNGDRNPFKLAAKLGVDKIEAEVLMDFFEMNLLIRTCGRTLVASGGTILHTIYIPTKSKTKSIVPRLYNFLLLVGWLPMLLIGIYRMIFASYSLNNDYSMILGIIVALVSGLIVHEFSHAMACLAYGGSFLEAGVMWEKICPGAYVLIDNSEVKAKTKRVQINAAGIESNMFLAGVFLVLCTMIEWASGIFLYAAILNVILAIFNLALIGGLDGFAIISELLGLKYGVDEAKILLGKCLRRKRRANMTVNRKVAVVACVIIILYQILVPIVIIDNVLTIIGGFL